jgi:hypothetical protein
MPYVLVFLIIILNSFIILGCEESNLTGSKILDDRQKKCDKSDKASRDKLMNNPESQV